jgi:hypothetical protein
MRRRKRRRKRRKRRRRNYWRRRCETARYRLNDRGSCRGGREREK